MTSKVVVLGESIQFIYCGCGCGFTRSKYNITKKGNEQRTVLRKFIDGHECRSEKIKKILSEQKKGSKNPQFGKIKDNITSRALHNYVRRHNPPPEFCHMCKEKPPRDLANITGIYDREFKNWAYFCHICHCKFDNLPERTLRRRWSKK